jgi:hypothetical protein
MNFFNTNNYGRIPSKTYSINDYLKLMQFISKLSKHNPTRWVRISDLYEIGLLCKYYPNCVFRIKKGLFGFKKFYFYDNERLI